MVGPNRGKRNFDPDYISRVMDESLQRLQIDTIDLYQLHNPTSTSSSAAQSGKSWSAPNKPARSATTACRSTPWKKASPRSKTAVPKPSRSNTTCSPRNRREKIFPLAHQANIGIIARVPLRRGILTGKDDRADEQRFQGEDVRARSFKGEAFAKELAKADELRFLVHGGAKTLGQAAIAFCIAHPAVSVVIPGARNAEQMRENGAAADLEIPTADLARIAELWRRGFLV